MSDPGTSLRLLVLLGLGAAALVLLGAWITRRMQGPQDFFVAGRRLGPGLVFTTLLAANIGAGSTVGAAGLGYRAGLGAWWWSGSAAIGCLFLGLFVAPRMNALASRHGFLTLGDWLEWRYGRTVRGLLSGILCLGTLSILAGQLIAMAWALQVLVGIPKAWGCLLSGLVLASYFAGAGLLASVYVNLLQLAVLLAGFALALPYAWSLAGGWGAIAAAGPGPGYGRLDGLGLAGTLGYLVIFVPSFMVSPGLVQKAYGARDAGAARTAALANAAALALFAFVPAVLGMAARVARPELSNPELALPTLLTLLPPWVGAFTLAALFAAEISTADAVLFMLSTALSQDVYRAFVDREAGDARVLQVGRAAAVGSSLVGVGLAVLLPSVVDALRLFYAVMTVSLFVPVVVGLASERATGGDARRALAASLGTWSVAMAILWGTPAAAWLPHLAGIVAALLAFLPCLLRRP